jgi:hypothetical protein
MPFWKVNNLSPVPFAYQERVVPGGYISRNGINSSVPQMSPTAANFKIIETKNYQPKVVMNTKKDGGLIGNILGYGAQAKVGTTHDIEIGEANLTCRSIPVEDVKKLIYTDTTTKDKFSDFGAGTNVLYVVEMVCYATSLTATDNSSEQILAGFQTAPPACTNDAKEQEPSDTKVSDLLSDAAKKATSSFGVGGSYCVDKKKNVVFNSSTPVAVASKLWWVQSENWKYKAPPQSTTRLRTTPWVDLKIQ